VIDGGELPGTPSTVVDLGELEATGRWRIVREGALTRTAVERALVGS
jgi:L-threonylcarbamoyladenylate synthase